MKPEGGASAGAAATPKDAAPAKANADGHKNAGKKKQEKAKGPAQQPPKAPVRFSELSKEDRYAAKKKERQRFKEMGQNHVTATTKKPVSKEAAQSRKGGRRRVLDSGDALIEQFKQQLSGGTFRMLNEQIYTTPSQFAGQLLRDRSTYDEYHTGYRRQVAMWPSNPVDVILDSMKKDRRGRFIQNKSKHLEGHIPTGWVIADLGCGDAAIAKSLDGANKVHSFDFCAANELVTPCDMAALPLEKESVDIAIFSLSLMSTNYLDYVYEAHRILRPNKLLKIAEVRSRLPDPERFALLIESIGFKLDWWGIIDGYFCVFDFVRTEGDPNREPFSPDFDPCTLLTPCLYKRR
jgi:ribosomal RNA-processing protein 8